MDHTKTKFSQPGDAVHPTDHEVNCAKYSIRGCLQRYGYAYWPTIYNWSSHSDHVAALSKALNEMIADGEVRKREDELEHDWEYSLNTK